MITLFQVIGLLAMFANILFGGTVTGLFVAFCFGAVAIFEYKAERRVTSNFVIFIAIALLWLSLTLVPEGGLFPFLPLK